MSVPHTPPVGKVYLVGAGPGDPGLITLRGVECLRRAEVVLYDYLVNPQILRHAPPAARLICLGRHGGQRIWSQEEITAQVIHYASQGQVVVRLKGGDPMIFARLAEEAEALAGREIPFEIVPGITAALAAGSYAGIPVTDRELASAVALVTGQEHPEKQTSSLDYQALARFPGTLVFYMGVTTAAEWTSALIAAGKPPDTPAAIVRRCSLPTQQTIRCRLEEVPDRLSQPRKLRPPSVVIVGPVAGKPQTLDWFQRRPLFGRTILVTRPLGQSDELAERLAELGAEILIQPAIAISAPADWSPVDRVIARLHTYDWVVFSSANGVRFFLERLFQHHRKDVRALAAAKLACIGPGTAETLAGYHLRADLLPDQYRAEALASALAAGAAGRRFLLVRASRGREVLAEQLQAAHGDIDQVVAYTSLDTARPDPEIHRRLAEGGVDWVTVTSSAIARSLVSLFGGELKNTCLASISPITSGVLKELGFSPAAEAVRYTMDGLIQAILAVRNDHPT